LLLQKILSTKVTKSYITHQLEINTGYHVVIFDPLQWHYSIHPTLTLEKVIFSIGKIDFIKLENVKVSLELLPLLKGQFSVDFSFKKWQQNQLHFSNGAGHLDYNNKLLVLSHFKSKFYQGSIQSEAKIDLSTESTPKFKIKVHTSRVEIKSLLGDIADSKSVSGKMNTDADFTSQGKTPVEFIRHLNGRITVVITNGELITIHLGKYIPNMNDESGKISADIFEKLKITAPLLHGVARTTITLRAKNYYSEGKGKINLNNQSLDVRLNTYLTGAKSKKNIAIPATLTGPISSPEISVEITEPLKQLFKSDGRPLSIKIKQLTS